MATLSMEMNRKAAGKNQAVKNVSGKKSFLDRLMESIYMAAPAIISGMGFDNYYYIER